MNLISYHIIRKTVFYQKQNILVLNTFKEDKPINLNDMNITFSDESIKIKKQYIAQYPIDQSSKITHKEFFEKIESKWVDNLTF